MNKLLKKLFVCAAFVAILPQNAVAASSKDKFPDGTPVSDWFRDTKITPLNELGKVYTITDYDIVNDSTILQTERIQAVIDKVADNGGGVVRIPEGTYLSGSLFFKPGTHLYLDKGAVLKGSDDISDFKIIDTRMEGQSIKYFAALVNAIGVNGFTISGEGTLNGNGMRYWKSFWLRRQVNKNCTNLEEMRPRLVYIAESRDVMLSGVRLENSPFWTTHLYRCENVKILNLDIFAPHVPVKAPSSDAVDMDVCKNILIKGCKVSVNDDAFVFKGGKGPDADKDSRNGMNEFIIVEDCDFGFCHSAMTVGSESLHTKNVLFRRCTVDGAQRLLWLKMRPDTPQNYEYIEVSDIKGNAGTFLYIKPWTQFFDLKGGKKYIMSYSSNVTMKNIKLDCKTVFDIKRSDDQYLLSDFVFENLELTEQKEGTIKDIINNCTMKNVKVNGKKL
ncbi:MAG: glycosyl hydrolase family 28 protein [Prevotellaceae bacterium]|nr:glycosyl hydrolase family 28 protein [Prevotellaceae bacterium]